MLIAERVDELFLISHERVFKDIGGEVLEENAPQHCFVVGAEIGQNLRNIRRGKFDENFAELVEIALANQFGELRLEQVSDHAAG